MRSTCSGGMLPVEERDAPARSWRSSLAIRPECRASSVQLAATKREGSTCWRCSSANVRAVLIARSGCAVSETGREDLRMTDRSGRPKFGRECSARFEAAISASAARTSSGENGRECGEGRVFRLDIHQVVPAPRTPKRPSQAKLCAGRLESTVSGSRDSCVSSGREGAASGTSAGVSGRGALLPAVWICSRSRSDASGIPGTTSEERTSEATSPSDGSWSADRAAARSARSNGAIRAGASDGQTPATASSKIVARTRRPKLWYLRVASKKSRNPSVLLDCPSRGSSWPPAYRRIRAFSLPGSCPFLKLAGRRSVLASPRPDRSTRCGPSHP